MQRLCAAFGYAERWRATYVRAARQHSIARNSAALLTIPLAADVVFEGLRDGGSSSLIARRGVQAVGIYSLANYLTARPRQKVYLSGAKAMVCAMFEARPLLVGAAYSGSISTAIAEVEKAQVALSGALPADFDPAEPGSNPIVRAQSEAVNAISKARRARAEIAVAGMTLRNRVDLIATQVAELVVDTEPSLESLNSLFMNFGSLTTSFTQGVTSLPRPQLPQTQSGFGPQLVALRDRTAELNALLNTIGETTAVIDRISQCRPEAVDSGFQVTPDDASVVVEAGNTFEFTVQNRVATPTRRLEGAQAAAVTLGPITVKGADLFGVVVTGVTATADDGPTLVITDGTGSRSKSIKIIVTATSESGGAEGQGQGQGANPAQTTAQALDDSESMLLAEAMISVRSLQCYVDTAVDGDVGSNTREAIASKRTSSPDDPARRDRVDTALIVELQMALASTHMACVGV